ELNAAVGLAQIARLDEFLAIQKKNYSIVREALEAIEGITFRRVPEGGVESYAFLNFFLPDADTAKKAHTALGRAGVDACFYWYNNNWHYYRKWEHLIHKTSLGKLPQEVYDRLPDYSKSDFSKSDHWVGRNISYLIKLGWSEDEVRDRAAKVAEVMGKVLK
ncbi:MAG TPA: DegT/DnrJ/EryC1/StrS family aminotransferase, partial [Pricia sp.]|nr:DegT/DnrJ/EryC1/StrS family aminotransferase [Pricia sp.]